MEKIIELALKEVRQADDEEEVPVGAVIFNSKTKEVLCSAHNLVVSKNDPTAHAEILVLQRAGELLCNYNLTGYSVFVTLEPCAMCAGALSWAKVDAIYFGAYDVKTGAIENGPCLYRQSTVHHKPQVFGGFCERECQKIMTDFFKKLRKEE